jgi:hypothetical protein
MLRDPQHERKITHDINSPPFVLTPSKDSDRVFQPDNLEHSEKITAWPSSHIELSSSDSSQTATTHDLFTQV